MDPQERSPVTIAGVSNHVVLTEVGPAVNDTNRPYAEAANPAGASAGW